ncbi:hypothetical protein IVIADoCa7_11 [Xanthomonas phage vB_Xar_IVIA-DoCa7]|uniref:Uncharacterized protein n=1 Tax=Xanthomonas phage vB_Xar_IVIA-DoCa7 TaxID=2975534 RepID=A0A9X9JR04_9CAUD|nr:hypothetical protein IVIADoCa7_11 [Xanthomonas phage vB_Xar_IVIA-DoCa7]
MTFLSLTLACLAMVWVMRLILLVMLGYVTRPELRKTGAFRKHLWKYLGCCVVWGIVDGETEVVANGKTFSMLRRTECVLGFYPFGWKIMWPQTDGFLWGWALGPVAYSQSNLVN